MLLSLAFLHKSNVVNFTSSVNGPKWGKMIVKGLKVSLAFCHFYTVSEIAGFQPSNLETVVDGFTNC